MKILVACEFSGRVRQAFAAKGHDVWSCDLIPSDDKSKQHIIGDALAVIASSEWDMLIAFPPCTYLSIAGNAHWDAPGRAEKREQARDFFISLLRCKVKRVAVENPVGYINTSYRKPDQIFHPYYFGEPVKKRTCLWLKNLPKLKYLEPLPEEPEPIYIRYDGKPINYVESLRNGSDRARLRSKTFQSVANAMANQWSEFLPCEL